MEKKIKIILGVGFFICCVLLLITFPYNLEGAIFIVILLVLSLATFQKNLFIQYIVFLFVFLLFLQTFLGNIFISKDYITLTPNTKIYNLVVGDTLPGVSGMISVQTDIKGFRVTKPINYAQPVPYRIFLIGGSTIEQIYIDDQQTSSYLLHRKLENILGYPVEVINTGVSGLLARNHLATLTKIEKYHPNLVIIMMGANDWNRQVKNYFSKLPSIIRNIRSEYSFVSSPTYKLVNLISNYFKGTSKLTVDHGEYYSCQNNSLSRAIQYKYRPQDVSNEFCFYTKKIFAKCQKGKYKTLVIAQISSYMDNASDELKRFYWCTPPNEKYTLEFSDMVYLSNLYNRFLEREARYYDLLFCKINIPPTTDYFYDDMHLNKKGAEIFADDIFQCIIKNDLVAKKNINK